MRENLVAAIKEAFAFEGFQFKQGFTANIGQTTMELPCVWLCPVEVSGIKGIREGDATYKVVMYLFAMAEGFDEQAKEELWSSLEHKARVALSNLAYNAEIADLTAIAIIPDEYTYTGFRELSIKVTFNAIVGFCYG